MGEQVHVIDLAKDMIKLSGMTIKDTEHPDGDIEITFTGLRPGEKLYEELLIDDKALPTIHEKISKIDDSHIVWDEVTRHLAEFEKAIKEENFKQINKIFTETVSGFKLNELE